VERGALRLEILEHLARVHRSELSADGVADFENRAFAIRESSRLLGVEARQSTALTASPTATAESAAGASTTSTCRAGLPGWDKLGCFFVCRRGLPVNFTFRNHFRIVLDTAGVRRLSGLYEILRDAFD